MLVQQRSFGATQGDVESMGMTSDGAFLYTVQSPSPIRAYAAKLDSSGNVNGPILVSLDHADSWAAQWSNDGNALTYASTGLTEESRPTRLIVRRVRPEPNGWSDGRSCVRLQHALVTR